MAGDFSGTVQITRPATPPVRAFDGFGTALKPAFEPIVLARKPLAEGSVARQCLATGTGALNIPAARIPGDDKPATSNERVFEIERCDHG